MTIDTSWVAQRNAAFLADPAARLAGNASRPDPLA